MRGAKRLQPSAESPKAMICSRYTNHHAGICMPLKRSELGTASWEQTRVVGRTGPAQLVHPQARLVLDEVLLGDARGDAAALRHLLLHLGGGLWGRQPRAVAVPDGPCHCVVVGHGPLHRVRKGQRVAEAEQAGRVEVHAQVLLGRQPQVPAAGRPEQSRWMQS